MRKLSKDQVAKVEALQAYLVAAQAEVESAVEIFDAETAERWGVVKGKIGVYNEVVEQLVMLRRDVLAAAELYASKRKVMGSPGRWQDSGGADGAWIEAWEEEPEPLPTGAPTYDDAEAFRTNENLEYPRTPEEA